MNHYHTIDDGVNTISVCLFSLNYNAQILRILRILSEKECRIIYFSNSLILELTKHDPEHDVGIQDNNYLYKH